jgi:hypothetical protein
MQQLTVAGFVLLYHLNGLDLYCGIVTSTSFVNLMLLDDDESN